MAETVERVHTHTPDCRSKGLKRAIKNKKNQEI